MEDMNREGVDIVYIASEKIIIKILSVSFFVLIIDSWLALLLFYKLPPYEVVSIDRIQ